VEYIPLFILLAVVSSSVVIFESASRKIKIDLEVSRKILHIIAGICTIVSLLVIRSFEIILIISIISCVITFFLVRNNYFHIIDNKNRKSWGIFFFPFSFTILNILFFGNATWVVAASMIISGFSDSFAALSGRIFPIKTYKVTFDKKSFGGSLIFFLMTFLFVLFLSSDIFQQYFNVNVKFDSYLILVALLIAALLTIFEAISSYGLDNVTVPIFGSLLLYVFLVVPNDALLYDFIIGSAFAATIAVISYYVKFLTRSGSTATFLLASFIFGFGGWKWSIPIMAFFILSSILSKVRKKANEAVETYFEKSGVRDHWQVIANGGIGGILVILNLIYQSELFYYIYVSSLAAVCADTWATEIGTMYKTKTYNILNLKPIDQGVSGGISLVGTLGGVLGAMIIALSGIYWVNVNGLQFILFIILSGVAGSFFDSILGASIQAQFECGICGKITEKEFHCDEITIHKKGFNWLNNDLVNLLAGIGGGAFILLFKNLLF